MIQKKLNESSDIEIIQSNHELPGTIHGGSQMNSHTQSQNSQNNISAINITQNN
jgi:hypothetical protein